ncbi:unnamed protein product [Polarella glacialis]|uniref:Uncharacterized protein n=1 Tax=Polarella glacialis TaxID=89957 RepID=A0A813DYA5_POLGL|nr:unnamed protein product [Polarella glacialis]
MARLAGASEPLEVPWRDVIAEDIDHPEEFFLQEGGAPGQAELALYAGRLLDLAVETQSQARALLQSLCCSATCHCGE